MKVVTIKVFALLGAGFILSCSVAGAQRPRKATTFGGGRTITIISEPKAIVWIDEIRRGVTDDNGRLSSLKLSPGAHHLRVRAMGFRESAIPISPAQRGDTTVRLVRTTDQAELVFQKAEEARENARDDNGRRSSAELYRQAINLRPAFASAHVGLARVLLDMNDTNGAVAEIDAARAARAIYPEASAVEGRIYRETGQTEEAIGAFNRAIREAHGFQPEAHVGIGRVYEEKGQYELAAREFKIAIDQLADTEPIIYQLLGAAYEKSGNNASAIAAYENYLRLAPNGSLGPALRSIVEQLKSQRPE
ncbi:MAG: tetratricopeptide repeat protein [Pyrinomonadaceae bacterium]